MSTIESSSCHELCSDRKFKKREPPVVRGLCFAGDLRRAEDLALEDGRRSRCPCLRLTSVAPFARWRLLFMYADADGERGFLTLARCRLNTCAGRTRQMG